MRVVQLSQANISDSNEGKLVSDRLGYGSAPFASVMRRINDVTFAKGLRCNGKTGVNTTLNAVLELYAGNLHVQFLGGRVSERERGYPLAPTRISTRNRPLSDSV